MFRHVHDLSLRFHLERRTGSLTKIVERGTKSIDMMLYFLLFNIAPTVIELAAICVIFFVKFGAGLVAATLAMVAIYIAFTRAVTDWRAQVQREMNEVDNRAIGRAVDSLLNYETVKYFGAEEREAKRYDEAIAAYASAAVKNETSLAWLNIGQSLITNVMMAGAMIFTVWGWSQGRFTPGDVVLVNALLMQLFRPLDMLGWVYRSIRQGLIDMEAMFDLLDTPAEVVDAPGAPPLDVTRGHVRFENVRFGYEPEREILKGVDLDVPPGTTPRRGRPVGRRQVDARAAALPLLRPDRRPHHRSTARTSPRSRRRACARRSASSRRTRCCSTTPSATTSATAATAPAQDEIEDAARGRGDRRLHRRACRDGYEFDGRRARPQAVGRREAARRHRPDPAQEPADPGPRRGDQRARQPHRAGDPGHARPRSRATGRRSSSPTACRRSSAPTRSSSSTRAGSPSAARTTSCSSAAAFTPSCGTARRPSASVEEAAEAAE